MWLGLALSYFLLCRASELWAYVDGKVHPEFCLTRNCLTFSRGEVQVKFENKATANSVQVRFVASTTYQKREGCTITRTRLANTCLLYTSPSPRDKRQSRMPSSA